MRKLTILLLSLNALTACAQKVSSSKVPLSVRESFTKTFPGAAKAGWLKEKEGNYEAEFEASGQEMSATFNGSGKLLETESEIAVSALPLPCGAYLRQNYPNSRIREAALIKLADGSINYEVEVKGFDLIFDQGGNFLRAVNL